MFSARAYTSSFEPHAALVLTVRCAGSHMVAFIGRPSAGLALAPQMGAFGVVESGVHSSSVQLKCPTGPRVEPSHASQPIAQPLLNQKQAWPLEPVRLRSSTAPFDGIGHHGSKGSGWGTAPPHGCVSESTAFRGLGMVIAECAEAAASQAASQAASVPTIKPNSSGNRGGTGVAQHETGSESVEEAAPLQGDACRIVDGAKSEDNA